MDWAPFVVAAAGQKVPSPRGPSTAAGLGDRLRTAAFAELQAREAFRLAGARFLDAPAPLRQAWARLALEEDKHLGWLLSRMGELGADPRERPVCDGLWRSIQRCETAAQFCAFIAAAEERGRTAEQAFARMLAQRDPETAAIFARIAADEREHIDLALAAANG